MATIAAFLAGSAATVAFGEYAKRKQAAAQGTTRSRGVVTKEEEEDEGWVPLVKKGRRGELKQEERTGRSAFQLKNGQRLLCH